MKKHAEHAKPETTPQEAAGSTGRGASFRVPLGAFEVLRRLVATLEREEGAGAVSGPLAERGEGEP
jgi:hypothetical protein